ncbi:PDZ domain-containing protein [Virgibacillus sp. MG-45]|uniref:PDZ domain-containing protein n=1 Tax=Virgibacillus sp. MG-45 TaxID=3102791 RepID=UPI002ED887A2
MFETGLIEAGKTIGSVFLNPLSYWLLLLGMILGFKRIKKERNHFGTKVFDVFSEFKNTWILSVCFGMILSIVMVGIGVVFSYETVLVLSGIIILFSLIAGLTLLSPAYTIGVLFFILWLAPFIMEYQTFFTADLFSEVNFTGIVILLGLLLFIEGFLYFRVRRNETFPELSLSSRGGWIGQLRMKKILFLPFLLVVPTGMITPFASFWPYFSVGDEQTFSIIILPFVLGIEQVVRGTLPELAAKRMAKPLFLLASIVLVLGFLSMYVTWLTLLAIVFAVAGKEFINFRYRSDEQNKKPYFCQTEKGITVLSVIPGTPASRLDIQVGEIISKVNGIKINSADQFYEALQESRASFKLDVLDENGELRFVQSVLYEGEHHELGLLFVTAPHHQKSIQQVVG